MVDGDGGEVTLEVIPLSWCIKQSKVYKEPFPNALLVNILEYKNFLSYYWQTANGPANVSIEIAQCRLTYFCTWPETEGPYAKC